MKTKDAITHELRHLLNDCEQMEDNVSELHQMCDVAGLLVASFKLDVIVGDLKGIMAKLNQAIETVQQ